MVDHTQSLAELLGQIHIKGKHKARLILTADRKDTLYTIYQITKMEGYEAKGMPPTLVLHKQSFEHLLAYFCYYAYNDFPNMQVSRIYRLPDGKRVTKETVEEYIKKYNVRIFSMEGKKRKLRVRRGSGE